MLAARNHIPKHPLHRVYGVRFLCICCSVSAFLFPLCRCSDKAKDNCATVCSLSRYGHSPQTSMQPF
uniref:Uncharacterized protein n=1 Tax=Arundo donax TaxID=35708 RepID=A0A0A9ABV9_ARUDO